MTIAKEIAPNLPYLRRFARALSGTQASGDAYVVAMLEALVLDPSVFPRELGPRIGLYRTFLKLWSSVGVNNAEGAPVELGRTPAERNLEALTPRPRQAFLLRTVEGFSLDEVAAIMDTTPAEASSLVQAAGQEIAEQVATDVLIIEDIVDSGMTLSFLKENLLSRGAASLHIATLLDKPERRVLPFQANYVGFTIPDAFVVGYGLDFDQHYRQLPYIGVLKPSVYE